MNSLANFRSESEVRVLAFCIAIGFFGGAGLMACLILFMTRQS